MQRSVNRNERKSSVCNSVHAHTEGGRRNKFNGSSCPDFFSPRARLVISIKRSENVSPFEASSRSLHRFPRFSQLEPFVPALCIIHLSPSLERKTSGDGAYFAQFAECHFKGRVIHGYEEKETLYDSRLVVGPCLPWIGRSTSPVSTWNVLSSSSWQTLVTGGNSCSNQRG